LSDKRDALRRGIRSLIHDTSREMADLEGRPAPEEVRVSPPEPRKKQVPPAAPHGTASGGVEPQPRPAASTDPAGAAPAQAQTAAPEARDPSPQDASATPPLASRPLEVSPGDASGGVTWIVGPPAKDASPAPDATGSSGPAGVAQRSRTGRAADGARSARRTRRARQRAAAGFAVNGINPQQARSRKGVCFAYFVNHECWRVPDAYCNTALQVCALRNCPVYHLHRAALERRFSGKFKHFW
jgi:hypothetical protein